MNPATDGPTVDHSSASASAHLPVIAGYAIRGELGRGGMGLVYEAEQVGLNRLVALKTIRSGEFASPLAVARFRHGIAQELVFAA